MAACLDNIRSKLKVLTESEKKVALYLLDNYDKVLESTVTDVAESAGVSDATIVRFSRSVGYKGFQDLKINLAQESAESHKSIDTSFDGQERPDQIAEKVIRSEIEGLEETLNMIDNEELIKTANIIKKARRVVFFGSGGSAIVGVDAMHKMLKIGIQCMAQMDADVQAMQSSLLGEGDVAIGISHSGTNRHVIDCLKNARENGAITIGITTMGRSPMRKNCDYVLSTATKELVFKSESLSARIAQLAMLDALTSVIASLDYDSAHEAIQKTRKATAEHKF